MIWSDLSVRDFRDVTSDIYGGQADEFVDEDVMWRAKRIFDTVAGCRLSGNPPRSPVHAPGADRAAALVRQLVEAPPVTDRAGAIAYGLLTRYLERNDLILDANPDQTVLRFEQVARDPAGAVHLERWVRQRIAQRTPGRRRRSPNADDQQELFAAGEAPDAVVGVFVGGPVDGLTPEERTRITRLHHGVEEALRRAAERINVGHALRMEHPSVDLPRSGDARLSDEELWQYSSRLILEQVDALVLTDVALERGGFEAGCEFDLHAAQDGPILLLRKPNGLHGSRYVDGRRREVDVEVVQYRDEARIPALVRRWVIRRWASIAAAARHRDDRMWLYRPLQQRLRQAWSNHGRIEQELAADAAGMSLLGVNRLLTSIPALATAPTHRTDALCRRLGVTRDAAPLRLERRPRAAPGPRHRDDHRRARQHEPHPHEVHDRARDRPPRGLVAGV